ncbi:MAG: hypothetical protein HYZ26_06245 [Chloroflexi bacterium]|nr:hypothetical protein [Chloroflexota bacterium]
MEGQLDTSASLTEKLKKALQNPHGSFVFWYQSPELLLNSGEGGIVLEIISGSRLIRLEKSAESTVDYYYSTPGSGTRRARINLSEIPYADRVFIALTWSPQQTSLSMGPEAEGGRLVHANGEESRIRFRLDVEGNVCRIGDQGVFVAQTYIYRGEKMILEPTAIEYWRESLQAIQVLKTAKSSEGFMFEALQSNLIVGILTTGFEVYCKRRFIELEGEGISPNLPALIKMLPKSRVGYAHNIRSSAEFVAASGINFQNWDISKEAFNKGYGIVFGQLPVSGEYCRKFRDTSYSDTASFTCRHYSRSYPQKHPVSFQ